MSEALAGASIITLTVSLSLVRPKIGPLKIHHSSAAVIGALLTIALPILTLSMAWDALKLLTFPVITIVTLMLITLMAEDAGLFARLAQVIALKANGSGRKLFAYLFMSGTLCGLIFTNDAAVLIFTPLVFNLVEEVQEPSWTLRNKIPFYFSVLYVANVVGALVISNPINIIVTSLFHIPFIEYARWMILPSLMSIGVSFAGIALAFWRCIPKRYHPKENTLPAVRPQEWLCAGVLGLVLLGFCVESYTGIPVWLVAVGGASVLLAARMFQGTLDFQPLVKRIGWDVIVFVAGIFVVARGLREVGLTRALGAVLSHISGSSLGSRSFSIGIVSAVCSAIANNHPTADTMTWVIRDLNVNPFETKILAFSALIGGDLGPKMLPIGSLAALLWFGILRKRNTEIPYSLYIMVGIPVTLSALVLALAALNLEVLLW